MAKPKQGDESGLKTLKADLKGNTPGRFYLFYGEETYLRDYYLSALREAVVPPGTEDFNLKVLEGKGVTVRDIVQAADCLPMMHDRTMVLVRDFDLYAAPESDRGELLALLADLPDYLCLVVVYDLIPYSADARTKLHAAIQAAGTVVEFPRQSQYNLNDWIIRHFKAAGHEIEMKQAEYLTFYCGDLMTNLHQEISKIAAYAKGKWITREDIEAVATPQLDAKTYELTDAISSRKTDKAVKVLGELFRMQEPSQKIIATLAKYLRQLYTARLALETRRPADSVVKLWKLKPYPASRLMEAARRVDLPWCRKALIKTARADIASKSSYGDDQGVLTQLVLELCHG